MPQNNRFGRKGDTENPSRRRVLRMTGSGLTAGAGIAVGTRATVAEDCTDEKCPLDKHTEDYAELIYDEWNGAVKKVKNGLEKANNDDHCKYHMNDNKVLVMQPYECNFGYDGSGCGKTDFEYEVTQTGNYSAKSTWEVYLSDNDTEEAVEDLRGNYWAFNILSVIISKKRAHGAVLFAAAQAQKYSADKLESTNEGCGVKMVLEVPSIKVGDPLDKSWDSEGDLDFDLYPQQEN